ncbi:MAG: hypothetical protein DRP08_08180 [Candidatus Aenigmatarchaeota archaeon]|nr:MAG: hypothetical protein DRP08_08180 [Candidatus Aenigmarchaeota archaeon]
MGRRVPAEIKAEILRLLDAGWSFRAIARETGVGHSTITQVKQSRPIAAELSGEHVKPDFTVRRERAPDPLDLLRQAVERTEQHPADSDYAKIVIDTDRPIAVMKAADLHFGGLDVDYKALLAHAEFLFAAKGFYLQLFGDDLNLMIMHRVVSARHDGWTPAEQVAWLESFVDRCLAEGKLLSMAWGNHTDEFTERRAGFGLVRMLMKHRIPYFRGLGYIDLQVGKQTYPMGFTHKVRFHSFMNALHGNKRMEQMHAEFFSPARPICREYITAHTHYPAVSMEGCLPSDRIYFIKCGTFKTNCLYSQRYYGQGRIGVPTVVYHPDRFEHIAFPTPWEAYRYLMGRDWRRD